MLQEACDALIDNGRRGRAIAGTGNHRLKSLSDMLKGKQGRFRQNLLGKRVDYSGRSVIVVGPELKLHQCGLPKKMALELFKPFVMRQLVEKGFAHNIKSAKRIVERVRPGGLGRPRRGHQGPPGAPQPRPHAPPARHPGVHAGPGRGLGHPDPPARLLGLQRRLRRRPDGGPRAALLGRPGRGADDDAVDGEPAVAGRRHADRGADPGHGPRLLLPDVDRPPWDGDVADDDGVPSAAGSAFERHVDDGEMVSSERLPAPVGLHGRSRRGRCRDEVAGELQPRTIRTTVGRIIFNGIMPDRLRFTNQAMRRTELKKLVDECYRLLGPEATALLVDGVKRLGFEFATRGGMTIGLWDITTPSDKGARLSATDAAVTDIDKQFARGLITDEERYEQVVELWQRTTKDVSDAMRPPCRRTTPSMMTDSGARGNKGNIGQLGAMRGLMADPSGRIIDVPVRSNFREGMSVLEYFISTHGARKGLADTALRTADSGYLTRRLVDVAQDVITRDDDCGTEEGAGSRRRPADRRRDVAD